MLKFFHLNISHFYFILFFSACCSCFNEAHCSYILLSRAKIFRIFSWFLQDITFRNILFLWAFKLVILFPYSMVFHCCYILFCFFLLFTNYRMGHFINSCESCNIEWMNHLKSQSLMNWWQQNLLLRFTPRKEVYVPDSRMILSS